MDSLIQAVIQHHVANPLLHTFLQAQEQGIDPEAVVREWDDEVRRLATAREIQASLSGKASAKRAMLRSAQMRMDSPPPVGRDFGLP